MELAEAERRVGTVARGRYRIEAVIGLGGMAVVYRARHLVLEKNVALKVLHGTQSPTARARLLAEARAAARLTNRFTVRVLDADTDEAGEPFLVMELLGGEDLASHVKRLGPLQPSAAVDVALQVCVALAEAHAAGIIHRDIKPANVFVTGQVIDAACVKVLDFGISKATTSALTLTQGQASLGSPLFMSPEQLLDARAVDPRTDVWSLGVTLYHLLTGRYPFEAEVPAALVAQIISSEPKALAVPGLPEGLEAVVLSCLHKQVDARPADVTALAERLAPFSGSPAVDLVAAAREAARTAPPPSDPVAFAAAVPTPNAGTMTSSPAPSASTMTSAPTPSPAVAMATAPTSTASPQPGPSRWVWVTAALAVATVVLALGYLAMNPRLPPTSEGRQPAPVPVPVVLTPPTQPPTLVDAGPAEAPAATSIRKPAVRDPADLRLK